MFAQLILWIVPFLPSAHSATPAPKPGDSTIAAASAECDATATTYVWAHRLCDMPCAVAHARACGFVPISRPIFRAWVPEASGPAWIVFIRPAC